MSSGREEDARIAVENYSGEMGGGSYTYLTLAGETYHLLSPVQCSLAIDQVRAGAVDVKYIDKTVEYILRTKFTLGLFESMSPCPTYTAVYKLPRPIPIR